MSRISRRNILKETAKIGMAFEFPTIISRTGLGHSPTKHFVNSVLSRKQPLSDLESAVRSDLICHLCDISIRTGYDAQAWKHAAFPRLLSNAIEWAAGR